MDALIERFGTTALVCAGVGIVALIGLAIWFTTKTEEPPKKKSSPRPGSDLEQRVAGIEAFLKQAVGPPPPDMGPAGAPPPKPMSSAESEDDEVFSSDDEEINI